MGLKLSNPHLCESIWRDCLDVLYDRSFLLFRLVFIILSEPAVTFEEANRSQDWFATNATDMAISAKQTFMLIELHYSGLPVKLILAVPLITADSLNLALMSRKLYHIQALRRMLHCDSVNPIRLTNLKLMTVAFFQSKEI